MPVARSIQASLASGEFDPLLWSREDVSFFYNSARIIENAVPLPQGGAKRREGWSHRAKQRGLVSRYAVGSWVGTAPNGGIAANALDADPTTYVITTTAIGTATTYVIFSVDMQAPLEVHLSDARGLHFLNLPSGVTSGVVSLQSSPDNATWTTRASLNVGSNEYNRRFGGAPDKPLATARYWRLIVDNPGAVDFSTATVEFYAFWAYQEDSHTNGGTPGEFSLHRHTSSIENEYIICLTDENVDVFRATDGVWVAAMDVPHTDAQVAAVKNAPQLDTLILYHEDVEPFILQRLGSDSDWRSEPVQFDSVVQFAFGDDDVSGGTNEIQFLRFESMAASDKLVVEFNGQTSAEVVWTANEVTNAANLETAIEGLDDITSVTVAVDTGTGANADLTVEFTGVDGKQPWAILIVDILTGSGTVTLSRKQYGRPDTDALWSATRGYPSCGTFYQGRHWMSGFKARPDVIAASRSNAIFDFKEDADPVASSPIVVAPNVDDEISIHNLYPGRHLQIFASSAEMYIPSEPITVDNIAIKTTTRHGSQVQTQPVDIQGGTLFFDRNGRTLREYLFQDAEQSYSAEPVSLLAGHLVASPRSLVLRRARDVDEPSLLLIANTGTDRSGNTVPAAMCVIDRAQQVTGFFRVATQGTPLSFATSQSGNAFAMTRRALAGVPWNYLEQFDDACMSDAGVRIAGSGSTVDLTGIAEHLEGQTVYVHTDGLPAGEFTVSSNQIDLGDRSYTAEVEVGLRMVPRIVLHPYKGRGDTSPTMQRQRIFRVLMQLERTGGIAITAADGGRVRDVSLRQYDSGVMDHTIEQALFTGAKRIGGLGQWQIEPTVTITQVDPLPFLLRSVTYDIRF